MALLAQLALAHGFFRTEEHDLLTREFPEEEHQAGALMAWLGSDDRADPVGLLPLDRKARLRDTFDRFLAAGREAGSRRAGGTVRSVWAELDGAGGDWHRVVAKLGFGHGALSPQTIAGPEVAESKAVEAFGKELWKGW
jgi:hypothetical protein